MALFESGFTSFGFRRPDFFITAMIGFGPFVLGTFTHKDNEDLTSVWVLVRAVKLVPTKNIIAWS